MKFQENFDQILMKFQENFNQISRKVFNMFEKKLGKIKTMNGKIFENRYSLVKFSLNCEKNLRISSGNYF